MSNLCNKAIPDCEDEDGTPIISMNSIKEDGELVKEGIRKIKLPNKSNMPYLQKGDLLFNWRNGSKHLVGKTAYFDWEGEYVFASFLLGIRAKPTINSKFLWHLLNHFRREGKYLDFMRQNVNGLFNREELRVVEIPLPPLSIQKEIVEKIESFQRIIDGAKQVVAGYKPQIDIQPDWEMVELGEVCEVKGGKRLPKGADFAKEKTNHAYLRVSDFINQSISFKNLKYIDEDIFREVKNYTISKDDVYISIAGTIGVLGSIPEILDGAKQVRESFTV